MSANPHREEYARRFPLHDYFFTSAKEGADINRVIELVERTGDVNQKDNRAQISPLMLACWLKKSTPLVVQALLLLGSDPKEKEKNGKDASNFAR